MSAAKEEKKIHAVHVKLAMILKTETTSSRWLVRELIIR
jgi:hypothetical protein